MKKSHPVLRARYRYTRTWWMKTVLPEWNFSRSVFNCYKLLLIIDFFTTNDMMNLSALRTPSSTFDLSKNIKRIGGWSVSVY
jgi:hypothetical protein